MQLRLASASSNNRNHVNQDQRRQITPGRLSVFALSISNFHKIFIV